MFKVKMTAVKCFNERHHFKAECVFECVSLISELSIYMYAQVEKKLKKYVHLQKRIQSLGIEKVTVTV